MTDDRTLGKFKGAFDATIAEHFIVWHTNWSERKSRAVGFPVQKHYSDSSINSAF